MHVDWECKYHRKPVKTNYEMFFSSGFAHDMYTTTASMPIDAQKHYKVVPSTPTPLDQLITCHDNFIGTFIMLSLIIS